MMYRSVAITGAALVAIASTASGQEHRHGEGHQDYEMGHADVPLYDDLGDLHYPIRTTEPLAQRYFDQGLRWLYAFNHAAAIRSFEEAERIDPGCAMCAWGIAHAYGPNINAPMDSASGAAAHAALRRALSRLGNAGPVEVGMIRALEERYGADPTADRSRRDSAYARAMGRVADRFPDDLEAQVLHADALMNLSPWRYWTRDGEPRPDTPTLLRRLEQAMERNPDHPGACHLFIHAVEARYPERAVPCAERLAELMPGAGHIVHMPGHIYIRVGRYADAIEANRHAVHADESYLEGPHVEKIGIYAQGYYPHNYHFMNFAASMAGDGATAIHAARRVVETVGPEVARAAPSLEAITPVVYWTQVTFGRWDEILAEPLPPSDLRLLTGMAYYARGMAFATKGDWREAEAALDTVDAVAEAFPEGDNRVALQIAGHVLAGEIAMRRGALPEAIGHFEIGAELEDGLTYSEPPTWHYPVRHSLGKALLLAGRYAEAERVYREDLERFPENGWSLFGLKEALRAQGRTEESEEIERRFRNAWRHADVRLTASRF